MPSDIETGIWSFLAAQSAVVLLLGAGGDNISLIARQLPPVDPFRYVVFNTTPDPEYKSHGQLSTIGSVILTVGSYAQDLQDAKTLAGAVKTALDGFTSGLMGTVTVQGVIGQSSSSSYVDENQFFVIEDLYKVYYTL